MEYVLVLAAVAALVYLVYRRKDKPKSKGSGAGGRPGKQTQQK